MAQIKQFPKVINDLENCAGCQKSLTDVYAIVELPVQPGVIKNIALCEPCHADVAATGIFG